METEPDAAPAPRTRATKDLRSVGLLLLALAGVAGFIALIVLLSADPMGGGCGGG